MEIRSEKQRFFDLLRGEPLTCSEVSEKLKIPQKNLTRYKRDLEKVNRLKVIAKARCPITGRTVQKLTTNPKLFPQPVQLTLFQNG